MKIEYLKRELYKLREEIKQIKKERTVKKENLQNK